MRAFNAFLLLLLFLLRVAIGDYGGENLSDAQTCRARLGAALFTRGHGFTPIRSCAIRHLRALAEGR
jgi:hypothetical protein